MSLSDIEIPLYTSYGEEKSKKLIVNEFGGRIVLTVSEKKETIDVECDWEDLESAWKAVSRRTWGE